MSNFYPIRICLVCLLAAGAFADSDAPAKTAAGNWQWSVALIKEASPDLDTLVRYRQASEKKTSEVVEKACNKLKEKLSELADATFYENPPFEGRIVLTLTLKRDVDWNLPLEGNRAAAVVQELRDDGDTKDLDRAEPLPQTDTRDNRHGKGKGKDFEIVAARVELFDLDTVPIASHECPRNDENRPQIRELARLVAPDMIRLASRNREMTAPSTDSTHRR